MKFNNKVYDVLKWLVLIALPAFNVFYANLAPLWGWGYVAEITGTLNVVAALIGALIGVSTLEYNKNADKFEQIKIED